MFGYISIQNSDNVFVNFFAFRFISIKRDDAVFGALKRVASERGPKTPKSNATKAVIKRPIDILVPTRSDDTLEVPSPKKVKVSKKKAKKTDLSSAMLTVGGLVPAGEDDLAASPKTPKTPKSNAKKTVIKRPIDMHGQAHSDDTLEAPAAKKVKLSKKKAKKTDSSSVMANGVILTPNGNVSNFIPNDIRISVRKLRSGKARI